MADSVNDHVEQNFAFSYGILGRELLRKKVRDFLITAAVMYWREDT